MSHCAVSPLFDMASSPGKEGHKLYRTNVCHTEHHMVEFKVKIYLMFKDVFLFLTDRFKM